MVPVGYSIMPTSSERTTLTPAGVVKRRAGLFTDANGRGVVRDLDPGMLLYPTGTKQGVMWEVEDELGNKGWVSSSLVELAR